VQWVLNAGAAGGDASSRGSGSGSGSGSSSKRKPNVVGEDAECTTGSNRARPAVPPGVRGFALRTTGVLQKYLGVVDAAATDGLDPTAFFSSPADVAAIWQAMVAHASQFVWFRRLYLTFSRYVYVNTFIEL
jgi:hypothetical protein